MALIRWDKCLFYFWSDFMVEVNAIAEKNLAPLKSEGFSVQYQYAEEKAKLPAVTYYELIDQESFRADNVEMSSKVRVQIDVWALKRSEMSRGSIRANELMQADGWMRELSRDMSKETENQTYHRTMRFVKEIWEV